MTPYTKKIVELHKIHKAIENCGCNKDDEQGGGDSGNLLISLIPNNYPKPALFLYQKASDTIDVTNYKIDDFLNLYEEKDSELNIMCLYESYNLGTPIINEIHFGIDGSIYFIIESIPDGTTQTTEVSYNNKVYYYYSTRIG